jgi:hypothetical protein
MVLKGIKTTLWLLVVSVEVDVSEVMLEALLVVLVAEGTAIGNFNRLRLTER